MSWPKFKRSDVTASGHFYFCAKTGVGLRIAFAQRPLIVGPTQILSSPFAMPRRLPLPEFIALLAFLVATVAYSIDSMLPALPALAQEFSPDNVNRAQLVVSALFLGLGLGNLMHGPISDALGRKPVIIGGLILYALAALAAIFAKSLEILLLARFIQGFAAAAPRIASMALVRDLYSGREMARITSIVMMVFILVPAIAPAVGQLIISDFGWRGVFVSFAIFSAISATWTLLRQRETLPKPSRRPLAYATLKSGVIEILALRKVRLYILVLGLGMGQMYALLSSVQQIYGEIFDKAESFPLWFAFQALLTGTGMFFNARFVMRFGMRRIAIGAYLSQIIISFIMLSLAVSNVIPPFLAFPAFFIWSVSVFFMVGLTFGNLTALMLEPLGHLAGLTSSLTQGIATIIGVCIAAPIGLMFNGTTTPLMIGTFVCSTGAFLLMRSAGKE